MKTARPYRSHRYPACGRCHKRRSRCVIEVPGQGCSLCYKHRIPCSLASTNGTNIHHVAPSVGFVHRSLLADDQSLESNAFLVGPVIARDKQILDQYLPHGHEPSLSDLGRQEAAEKPIYHMPIPPRMPSPTGCQCWREVPRELLAQVEPYLEELMSMYFEHVAPCYPIVDEEYIMTRIRNRGHQLPQLFSVILISHALFYWDLSPGLTSHRRPDQDLAWQSAVALNAASIQKGDVATIATLCIGVSGRPCQRLVNNATNVARCVALAHIVGLNHDCREWKIRDLEKRTRCKVWWGLLIQDRWFNFAQGTPPYISQDHYDVPVPTVELLVPQSRANSPNHVRAAEIYIQLCRLTEIIGEVLPMIYHLRVRAGGMTTTTDRASRAEVELDRWIERFPAWLNLTDFSDARPQVPGLVNLQLSYLAVRMLLRRIAWHEHSLGLGLAPGETAPDYSWLLSCQAAAEDVVRFVTSLTRDDLAGFWLPYNAHHFTSAVTLLLRCALQQTIHPAVRDQCMASARTLVDRLRRYREEDKWDLAETCLSQSESILKRIEDLPTTTVIPATATTTSSYSRHLDDQDYGTNNPMDQTLSDNGGEEIFAPQSLSFSLPGREHGSSLEELFPEIFGDWYTDNFLLEPDDFNLDA
ncbi:uncharacterized protein Z518_10104 [Rhinocladiella mackenziei CBS 650.93]|uniref:Rhinocladiella mackenziei CBS 650.93 unplaced genomic scaffold supercont1.8, whole genome shotgun sequence n=1 Tax=Rhinocladiella mackenziei CBS 650.93 TaxID=1442369 RepID=A0A0D2GRY6_9EURO|nr:uncharacterized protein Z518_10104 [Rhinocladiella mackenziei CBS 650.93]KIX01038.1 hypothetical protein Z518_10104 [Rhinocladiella mackenziei CBS 650.93]